MTIPITHLHKLKADVFLSLITNPCMKVSFSQLGEDAIIFHWLIEEHKVKSGFYVDIGCNHPHQFSNTFLLYLCGWRGVVVDANPDMIDAFRVVRPNDICVQSGIGQTRGEASFYRFDISAVSTFSKEIADKWVSEYGWKLRDISSVPVITIGEALEKHLPEGQVIHYLNIDIEGQDEVVIETFPFDRYKPLVLSVEIFDADKLNLTANRSISMIVSNGYQLVAICGMTYIFSLPSSNQ